MTEFTPVAGLAGGALIGLASGIYLIGTGRIAGISGMIENLLRPTTSAFPPAALFLFGMIIGSLGVAIFSPGLLLPVDLRGGSLTLLIAGLLIGFGTRMANGCTSGHGVCGIPRLSIRSIAATFIFMAAAMATVFVTRHLI